MEEVRKSLTTQEQVLLADFWENKDLIHAFQNALLQRQYQLAINTMAAAPNWDNVVQSRGKIEEDKFIIQFLELNFKEVSKRRNKAK